jgi:hypothetical protein
MEGFRKHPEAMLSITAGLRMDAHGNVIGAPLVNWTPGLYSPPDGFRAILEKGHPDWTSVVFRSDVLQMVGGLDEEAGGASDFDYLLRIAARFPIVVSTEIGAIFVVHGGNHSANPATYTQAGWRKIIANHTAPSDVIPATTVEFARKALTVHLVNTIFMTNGVYATLRKRWRDSHEAAHILRQEYGLWMRASLLDTIGWACENLPFAHRLFVGLNAVRRFLTKLKRRSLQRRFGNYAEYLVGLRQ